MLVSPKTPNMMVSGPASVVNAFIRLRDVTGDVACLDFGRKNQDYRGIIKVNAINFSLMSEDEQEGVIEGFKSFLNGISYPIQILIRNRSHNIDTYLRSMDNVEGPLARMAHDHAEFVRKLASRRALVKREFYIIVPSDQAVSKNKTEALINAQLQLKLRIEELLRQLERMGLAGQRLKSMEIIRLYQSCYTPWEAYKRPITQRMVDGAHDGPVVSAMEDSYSIETATVNDAYPALKRDQPDGKKKGKKEKKKKAKEEKLPSFIKVPDLIAPSSIQVYPWYVRIEGESEHEFVRTLALSSYPRSAYPGWFDSIIQVDEPNIDFSIHIKPLAPEQVNAQLSQKSVQFRGATMVSERQGRTPDPTATIALQDVEKLRENLARGNERVFSMSAFIQVRGRDRRELSERSDRIVSAVRSLDFRALPVHWQHHVGLLSCLPDCNNQLGRGRLFGTGSAATFYPFTNSDLSMDTGVMFGTHPNGGLVILNPFNNSVLENGNLVVFAKSGAGKSFFLKTVTSRLLPTCNVYVIDPEAEYNNMCEKVNGQYVRLSTESLQINPFELYGGLDTTNKEGSGNEVNFFREKLLNLIILLELLLSDDGTLPQKEKSFLYKCLIKTYENRGITMDSATHGRTPPNMQEFFVIMSSSLRGDDRFGIGQDVYGLSERLERYLHLFPTRTRVSLNNGFIDYNIRELNDALKPIGLFLITEFLWTKIRQARQSNVPQPNTIILIDEAWLLMQFPQGAKFLEELARRIRKYGGGLWCTTQNSDDFLSSDEGKTILAMATMKFLMKQDSSTIDSVVHTFHLSPGQKGFLLGARRGEGLFATRSWSQMEVVASPLEAEMANTTLASTLTQMQQSAKDLELNYQEFAESPQQESARTNGNGKKVRMVAAGDSRDQDGKRNGKG
ncbi:ATP-binding protein [Ktedonobacteria bacterium brp13]|nr:ATP-binding protein [Ktedonobacteria bacterium brp13]